MYNDFSQISYGMNNYVIPMVSDNVEILSRDLYTNKTLSIRLLGPIACRPFHVIKGSTRTKEGTIKEYTYKIPCLDFNYAKQTHEDHQCPYCKAGIKISSKYYQNCIVRDLQTKDAKYTKNEYESEIRYLVDEATVIDDKEKFKDFRFYIHDNKKKSNSFTPVRVLEISPSLAKKIRDKQAGNNYVDPISGEKTAAPVNHLKYGLDIVIMFNPNEKEPNNMYTCESEVALGRTPISKEERSNLLLWNIFDCKEPDYDILINEFKRSAGRITNATNLEYIKQFKKDDIQPKQQVITLNDADRKEINSSINEDSLNVVDLGTSFDEDEEKINDFNDEKAPWND